MNVDLSVGIVILASSFASALLALHVVGRQLPGRHVSWTPLDKLGDPVALLFRGRDLVDATPAARALMETGPGFLDDLSRTIAALGRRFPDMEAALGTLPDRHRVVLHAADGEAELEAEWRSDLVRVVLHERLCAPDAPPPDHLSHAALTEELATLRRVIDDAPILVWKEDAAGAVRWANGAYVDLALRLQPEGEPLGWPLPRVFGQRPAGPDPAEPPRRLSVTVPGFDEPRWYDSFNENLGDEILIFALPADRLVHAEATLREFMQTLTKTFAHLTTGLAVFDRERRLVLFNPALTDLSALEPQFLSTRPTLFEFLDRLRERQRMPEPKDYKNWRQQIAAMECAAASGRHLETWSLPTGQTFRVTGRPHPDGAVAFLFEDISAEISLTRGFRAELELGQSVLDTLDEAIAVFSSSGALVLTNAAYRLAWNHMADDTLATTGIVDATRHWQALCQPTPVWGDLRDFVRESGERAEWNADVRLSDGSAVACRFAPVAGHATLVVFSPIPPVIGARSSAPLPLAVRLS
ncbi:PAS-domain containing protein [Tropicimonas sp.]|uniref:PAS-domain containing protein n=1 Tax=Tropicimonas sp. TaxID=2067044 RepID=UPI003A888144